MTNINETLRELVAAQTLYKAAASAVSTKSDDNLRATVDDYYMDLYETTGAKSFEVKLDGHKVGTYSITVKEKPAEVGGVIDDWPALVDYFDTAEGVALFGAFLSKQKITDELVKFALDYLDGEQLPGVLYFKKHGATSTATGTLRLDYGASVAALESDLPAQVASLLEGAE